MSLLLPQNKNLAASIISLTWPQLCNLLCHFVIGFTDVWAGGRIGPDVQASIGLIAQSQMMLMIICTATVTGGVAAVSQSFGANRPLRARRYVGLLIAMALTFGTLISVFGLLFNDELLSLLRTPDRIRPTASAFLTATLFALPGHYGMVISTALFRSAHSVIKPLYVAILICLLNIIGDLGFGLGMWGLPVFGAAGIAWSTTAAATFGALLLLYLLWCEGLLTSQSRLRLRWIKHGARYLIKVMIPSLGMSAVWQSGYLLMFIIIATLPNNSVAALAGITNGLRIEALLFLPATACSMTAGVLVGNALGVGNREQAMKTAFAVIGIGVSTMSLIGAALWPLRNFLTSFLTSDADVHVATVCYLTYNILAVPFSVGSIIISGVMNGAGASSYPMKTFLLSVWGIRLPTAWLFGHHLWGDADGVFMAMLISQIVQSSFLIWILLKCDWPAYAMRAAVHLKRSTVR